MCHPQWETWWQHHAVQILFFSRTSEADQGVKMGGAEYMAVLEEKLFGAVKTPQRFTFQQDQKYAARATMKCSVCPTIIQGGGAPAPQMIMLCKKITKVTFVCDQFCVAGETPNDPFLIITRSSHIMT